MREHRLRALRGLTALAIVAGGFVAAPVGVASASGFHATATRAHVMRRAGPVRAATNAVGTLSTPNLTYYGGDVMRRVKIIEVLWGAGTYADEVTSDTPPNFPSFFGSVTNSSYFDWLSEYSANGMVIGRGSFAGRYTITPTHNLDDSGIQADLVDGINAHVLPFPDADTLFFLMFPQGSVITMGGMNSLTGFCAYHGTIAGTILRPSVRYAVLPDSASDAGCGASPGFANMTSVASHELVESVTDPDVALAQNLAAPLAWYDNAQGEIADICNTSEGIVTGSDNRTYTVQKLWSNQERACVLRGKPRLVSIGSGSILEGDAGTHTVRLPVTLSAPSTRPVTVSYTVHGVTAFGATSFRTGVDVTSTDPTGTVSFPVGLSGVTSVLKWISITVYGDTAPESNEVFKVSLSDASAGYGIGHAWQYVTILNDDPHSNLTVGVGDASVVDGVYGSRQIGFPVTVSRVPSAPVTVNFAATGISATAGSDFTGTMTGKVTFAANSTATTFYVVLNVPAQPGATSDKTLRLQLSSLHGPSGIQLVRSAATGTLIAR